MTDTETAQALAHRLEKGKGERRLTHEQILRMTARRGFTVSRRYRDDYLRRKTHRMAKWGLLEGGRGLRYGDGHSYRITPLGHEVLKAMEALSRGQTAPRNQSEDHPADQ